MVVVIRCGGGGDMTAMVVGMLPVLFLMVVMVVMMVGRGGDRVWVVMDGGG